MRQQIGANRTCEAGGADLDELHEKARQVRNLARHEIPLRRNRWGKFQRPPQGEFRAPAARKSDDTAEKVQPAGVARAEVPRPSNESFLAPNSDLESTCILLSQLDRAPESVVTTGCFNRISQLEVTMARPYIPSFFGRGVGKQTASIFIGGCWGRI